MPGVSSSTGHTFRSFIAAVRGRSLSLRSGGSGELSGPKQSLVFSQKPGGELFAYPQKIAPVGESMYLPEVYRELYDEGAVLL